MKIGPFDINEPLPELREPHAFAMLRPWVDVGNVGTLALGWLESRFKAMELGHLRKPGLFFDFTRYRPMAYFAGDQREIAVPNVVARYARMPADHDFVFLHLLEPHSLGEYFVDSLLRLMLRLNVKQYFLVGSMYDVIPHTRPAAVTGNGTSDELSRRFKEAGIRSTSYQGPTSIVSLLNRRGPALGVQAGTVIVHVPQYVQFEDNALGQYQLLAGLQALYDVSFGLEVLKPRADEQLKQVGAAVDVNPELKQLVQELEARYDALETGQEKKADGPLSPEVERFLRDIDKRFGQN